MKGSSKDFFDRESSHYEQFIKGRDFTPFLQERINPLLKGRVLDVGSGCISDFKDGSFDLYVLFDISLGMLSGLDKANRMGAVCGDALALPFREGLFDILIYRSVLHHLNPDGMACNGKERILHVFSEAGKVIKQEGKIIVVEPCLPPLLERFERWLAPLIRFVMRVLGLPYVFIFSKESLSELLKKGRWSLERVGRLQGTGRRWDWIQPVLGLPFIRIPRWALPSKIYMLQGRR